MKANNYQYYPTISELSEADKNQWYETYYGIKKENIFPICLVCGSRMGRNYKCKSCGYDQTKEYEFHKTIGEIPGNTNSVVKKRDAYQGKILQKNTGMMLYEINSLITKNDALSEKNKLLSMLVETQKKQISELERQKKVANESLRAGDTYSFGTYPQTTTGEKKAIEWKVLDVKDGKALLQSVYGLDAKPYNKDEKDITWEKCTLRKWLNQDFINTAFTAGERSKIVETQVSVEKNPLYKTNIGNNTRDKVFLLSIQEAEKYYQFNEARKCKATDYAKVHGAWKSSDTMCSLFWLRSPGLGSNCAAHVKSGGSVDCNGLIASHDEVVVRPALWINI